MADVIVLLGLKFYRRYLTRFTPKCPQTETCSAYAVRMIREHGVERGIELALIRVENCGRKVDV